MPEKISLTAKQDAIVHAQLDQKIFLEGPAGSGKTTAGLHRLQSLVQDGISADQILILAPQRSLLDPYRKFIMNPGFPKGGIPTVVTVGGLAQRLIDLFWPVVARMAGFNRPQNPPVFLTMESAQYFLARLMQPLFEKGYFESLVISRPRLYGQILDSLNKSALVGFSHETFARLLKNAWIGEPSQISAYDQAQEAAVLFRQYCKENNLLDYSLQVELFVQHIWNSFLIRSYLNKKYAHLIFDNIEEDSPIAHDLIQAWLPDLRSALLIFDSDAGIRTFLGADPVSAIALKESCNILVQFDSGFTASKDIQKFEYALQSVLDQDGTSEIHPGTLTAVDLRAYRFVPEMIADVVDRIQTMITSRSVEADEIAIVAPYMNDSLRFSFMNRLNQAGIPAQSHRPSRSLRDEPATTCMLTFAKLVHPHWQLKPSRFDIRTAFMQTITNGDLIRADLLAQIVQPRSADKIAIGSFKKIIPAMQERITYTIGNRFEELRTWLLDYAAHPVNELDVFISMLYGEVLSQPGFGYHDSFEGASVIARLIDSIRKFRKVLFRIPSENDLISAKEYITMVEAGILAAVYVDSQENSLHRGVLIAPAHSFLLQDRPVKVQFWLDVGSQGWSKRPNQPLTHPYVLSRHWQADAQWSDAHEMAAGRHVLRNVITGLIRRCSQRIILCSLEMNERGIEERGLLLQMMQKIYRKLAVAGENV